MSEKKEYILTLTPTGHRSIFKKREEWYAAISIRGIPNYFVGTRYGLPAWRGYDTVKLTSKAVKWFDEEIGIQEAEARRKARTEVISLGEI